MRRSREHPKNLNSIIPTTIPLVPGLSGPSHLCWARWTAGDFHDFGHPLRSEGCFFVITVGHPNIRQCYIRRGDVSAIFWIFSYAGPWITSSLTVLLRHLHLVQCSRTSKLGPRSTWQKRESNQRWVLQCAQLGSIVG